MELWQQILCHLNEEVAGKKQLLENWKAENLLELRCYRTLLEIRKILNDDTLDDPTCFWRIEKIVRVLERMGTDGGCRHDY